MKTIYVTVMWWNGRDVEVEEMVSGGLSGGIDAHVLVGEGVRIGCWRLQKLLEGFRREKGLKGILGVLDADTTMYVKDVASKVEQVRECLFVRAATTSECTSLRSELHEHPLLCDSSLTSF